MAVIPPRLNPAEEAVAGPPKLKPVLADVVAAAPPKPKPVLAAGAVPPRLNPVLPAVDPERPKPGVAAAVVVVAAAGAPSDKVGAAEEAAGADERPNPPKAGAGADVVAC